jgi:hypothetical protein
MRSRGGEVVSPLDKETWLRVAAEWMKLAPSIDGRQGKR